MHVILIINGSLVNLKFELYKLLLIISLIAYFDKFLSKNLRKKEFGIMKKVNKEFEVFKETEIIIYNSTIKDIKNEVQELGKIRGKNQETIATVFDKAIDRFFSDLFNGKDRSVAISNALIRAMCLLDA